jgi:DNA polymerase III epsilon subunit-like protein
MPPAVDVKKHKCGTCQKGFATMAAKRQHRRDKHLYPNASQANTSGTSPHLDSLTHRGITYSRIFPDEKDAIHARLASLCHSEQRLRKEKYTLSNAAVMENGSYPAPHDCLPCPDPNPSASKIAVIVLDCEMAGAFDGQNELIQITMIEFFSGRVLRSSLVNPSKSIKDWREDITGINAASMQRAVSMGEALQGWEAARADLWQLADKETILIGHSVRNDLRVLHTFHTKIIDSAILAADAVLGNKSKIGKRWALELLCAELLGIQIRRPSGGRKVHDALEDALATREVVLLCAREPDRLKQWADATRVTFFKGNDNKRKGPQAGAKKPQQGLRRSGVLRRQMDAFDDEDEDDYPLRWEDVIDWDMWPKSPPDSD